MYNIAQLKRTITGLGYKWFEEGDYNLNIIGVRNSSTGLKVTNAFDDDIILAYKVKDNWELLTYKFTTDNGAGTARLKAGQYRGAYMLGLHQGKYKALRQCGPVVVYRDFKNDGVYQEDRTERGVFGINIHKAGLDSIRVDRWSEGCQVFKRTQDFNKFMAICETAAEIWGNSFTYTLINSSDLTR